MKFKALKVEDRWNFIKDKKLCNNCLQKGHWVNNCQRPKFCKNDSCIHKHHWLLHNEVKNKEDTHVTYPPRKPERNFLSLRTVPVILNNGRRSIKVNALLDDASTTSYISKKVANELGLVGKTETTLVGTIGGNIKEMESSQVEMTIQSVDKKLSRKFRALAVSTVTGALRVINWNSNSKNWKHLSEIKFPMIEKRQMVDVLIGADYIELHKAIEEIEGEEGDPVARLTPLGWTCVGKLNNSLPFSHQTNFVQTFLVETELDNQLKRFWEIEEIVKEDSVICNEDKKILQQVLENMTKQNQRYMVDLPWKENRNQLTSNESLARDRLIKLERRFEKDDNLKKAYTDVINDYTKKGYIKKNRFTGTKENKVVITTFSNYQIKKRNHKIKNSL